MVGIKFDRVSKVLGQVRAVDNLTLDIAPGELFFLLGPSGCGKTTALRLVAGFYTPDEGRIFFNERDQSRVPPHKRNTGMVFQNYALWPHMTVAQNVVFGLRMQRINRAEQTRRVHEALTMVKMTGMGDRLPKQLSGGQQQRVALARALVTRPTVMLLDEPFASLDRKLRLEMQSELRELTIHSGTTAIFVTHDQEEALALSDRIAVMNEGRIEQIDQPMTVFKRPANIFVADFMGATNLFAGRVIAREGEYARIELDGRSLTLLAASSVQAGYSVTAAVRPESITLTTNKMASQANCVATTIAGVVYQGTYVSYQLRTRDNSKALIIARAPLTATATLGPARVPPKCRSAASSSSALA